MSKILFNKEDHENLTRNRYVLKVSEKSITYADEFKRLFIDEYMSGKPPREIFKENGFDIEVIGIKRIEQAAARWKKAYEQNGIVRLSDSRKGVSGRPLKRTLSQDEVIARQDARIRLLESQVEILKKLDMKERLLVTRGMNLSKSILFELIKDTVGDSPSRMVRYLCGLLNTGIIFCLLRNFKTNLFLKCP